MTQKMKTDDIRIGIGGDRSELFFAQHLEKLIHKLGLKSHSVIYKKQENLARIDPENIMEYTLYQALLEREIDIIAGQYKDLLLLANPEISTSVIGERLSPKVVLIKGKEEKKVGDDSFVIGTNSDLFKLQWKRKFPSTTFKAIEEYLPAALEQLWDSNWDGIFTSHSNLVLANMVDVDFVELDWLIPEPMQGIAIQYDPDRSFICKMAQILGVKEAEISLEVERDFQNMVKQGSNTLIGAHAVVSEDILKFKACAFDIDNRAPSFISKQCPISKVNEYLEEWKDELLDNNSY